MSNYINDTTQEVKSYYTIKADNPNTSIPKDGVAVILDIWYLIHATEKPSYDTDTQKIEEGSPVKTGEQWDQTWDIVELTQQEMDDNQAEKDYNVNSGMISQGQNMTIDDDARTSVGSPAIIEDRTAHDTWMQSLYAGADDNTPKPPAAERQAYNLYKENDDPFKFTRYHDQWGWRWRMDLLRQSVNALALYIQDDQGNYLYTTGALLDNGEGGWYTECPAGQADATPENVYFKWILGSAPISRDFVYEGSEDELDGHVKSDTDYD